MALLQSVGTQRQIHNTRVAALQARQAAVANDPGARHREHLGAGALLEPKTRGQRCGADKFPALRSEATAIRLRSRIAAWVTRPASTAPASLPRVMPCGWGTGREE